MEKIDRSKAWIKEDGFQFEPLRPKNATALSTAALSPRTELILFERLGEHRALIMREMAYHHVCQGELGGQPYLVSF